MFTSLLKAFYYMLLHCCMQEVRRRENVHHGLRKGIELNLIATSLAQRRALTIKTVPKNENKKDCLQENINLRFCGKIFQCSPILSYYCCISRTKQELKLRKNEKENPTNNQANSLIFLPFKQHCQLI